MVGYPTRVAPLDIEEHRELALAARPLDIGKAAVEEEFIIVLAQPALKIRQ